MATTADEAMWCKNCQQDVPGTGGSIPGQPRCPRCQTMLSTAAVDGSHIVGIRDDGPELDARPTPTSPPTLGNWRLERQLKDVRRLVSRSVLTSGPQWQPPHSHPNVAAWGNVAGQSPRETAPRLPAVASAPLARRSVSSRSHTPWFALLMIAWGLAGLGIGLGIMWWSITKPAPAWWSWGLAATLAGQGLLIIGLAFFALRLWQQCRRAALQLDNMESHLFQLHQASLAVRS